MDVGVNLFVRKSFKAVDLRRAVNEHLNPRLTSIRKDPALANMIARAWAEQVTKFVPRSNLDIPEDRHLQSYTVSDGRVIWSRHGGTNATGPEIAYLLYNGLSRGHFHFRPGGHQPHQPQPYWDERVVPGTQDWQDFVDQITPEIIRWVRNNG